MQKLHFSIQINAPREKVWKTMLDDKTYRVWTVPFNSSGSGESWFEGDWSKGSDIKFVGPDKSGKLGGMIAKVEENKPNEFISLKHFGIIGEDGKVEINSEESKKWAPAMENYTFKNADEGTELSIDVDCADEYLNFFNESWPKALVILKEISEK